jgi:hypothetical protein
VISMFVVPMRVLGKLQVVSFKGGETSFMGCACVVQFGGSSIFVVILMDRMFSIMFTNAGVMCRNNFKQP